MKDERYKLQPISNTSLDVQLAWTLGILAEFLKVTKKELRKATAILKERKFEDEVMVKGVPTKMLFHYGFFSFVKKIKNKRRQLLAPHPEIQLIFRAIKEKIGEMSPAHKNAFGWVPKRNIQKAVRSLMGNKHFISFDIANAFPSITDEMVKKALIKLGIEESLVLPLVQLVTYFYNLERRLPQGASCSPVLLNLVYKPMCQEIDKICKAHKIKWFVYGDDFHFAALDIPSEAKEKLLDIPPKYGFWIKKEKNKDNLGKTIPHLLGLTIVDGKIELKRKTKKKFRTILFQACRQEDHSPAKVRGVIAVIKQIYGHEKNWPGWLRVYWLEYKAKYTTKKGGNREKNKSPRS